MLLRDHENWLLRCFDCGREYDREPVSSRCECGGVLELVLTDGFPRAGDFRSGRGVWGYSKALPVSDESKIVTINEGNTPLIMAENIRVSERTELFIKNEGQNPTGSFKDRGMTVAVTRAKEIGAKTLVCASTGNTSASASAYAARGGMKAVVLVPAGKIAGGKLVQAIVHGAKVIRVSGDFDRALELMMQEAKDREELYVVNSINPFRIEGQKTGAFEIFEQLGSKVPDYVILPVGNAGNISAYWKGFSELKRWGFTDKTPRMIGVQAAGASPLVQLFQSGKDRLVRWDNPETVASAIRIGNPVSWRKALDAVNASGGQLLSVTDEEILAAQRNLASREGIFVEPASAAPLAAIERLKDSLPRGSIVVAIATGSGLKDQGVVKVDSEKLPLISDARELEDYL
ncbi:MAG: threonine synthase [Candidatus Thermoplasmatota archaeon]|nr:threonine synthase [Candidatus Thermoplasmatota archaeon]MCL5789808.1 threonine synthase [Candidatus Thermoplasmatota archaeon]